MADHIHMLVNLHPDVPLSELMRDVKGASSKFMGEHKDRFPMFNGWGEGYFACTVSPSNADKVINYIKNQKAHHAKLSTHDELRKILDNAGISYNEKWI